MNELADFYKNLAETLPEDGAALIISHGGIVEMSAIACLPEADTSAFGPHLECCEGVRLTWEDGSFTKAEVLRISN